MDRDELVRRVTKEVVRRLMEDKTSDRAQAGVSVEVPAGSRGSLIRNGVARVSAAPGDGPMCADIASYIDHTLLRPDATKEEIRALCTEASRYSFATVCVNPTYVSLCKELLAGSSVKVCTVVGFPLGASRPEVKAFETREAIHDGAVEIDMVMNVGALKSKDHALVERDIRSVVEACEGRATTKVIIEAALLTREEKVQACALAKAAGADFVKTSTGFGPGGATMEDVELTRQVVGMDMGVKAAGGIKDCETARGMIEAGATRIGASASIKIIGKA